jgi:hypothetical protein
MIVTDVFPEMFFNQLTWLIAREDFINVSINGGLRPSGL